MHMLREVILISVELLGDSTCMASGVRAAQHSGYNLTSTARTPLERFCRIPSETCPGLWTKLAPMGLGFRGLGFRVGGSGFGLRFGLNPNPNRTAEASVKQNVQLDAAP